MLRTLALSDLAIVPDIAVTTTIFAGQRAKVLAYLTVRKRSHRLTYMEFHPEAFTAILQRSGYPSRKAFADEAEISAGTLSDLISGRRTPSDALILRLAQTLRVPLTAIIRNPATKVA